MTSISCKIVPLQNFFFLTDRKATSRRAKSCAFRVHLFPHFFTQSARKNGIKMFSRYLSTNFISSLTSEVARVAQWLEHRAQRSDDACVGGVKSHCGTWVPVFQMSPYKARSRVAVGVAR
jgi:hypothetical protein